MTSATLERSAELLHRLTVVTLVKLFRRFSLTSYVDSVVVILFGLHGLGAVFSFSKSTLAFLAAKDPSPVADCVLCRGRAGHRSFPRAGNDTAADVDR